MLERLQLLDEERCDAIAEQVGALERWWTRRHLELPSFTLGGAAYLDVPHGGVPQYIRNRMRGNRILDRHFRDLIEEVVEALAGPLGGPTFLTERFAFPGFHIFAYHPRMHELEPRLHWDLQDMRLPELEDEPRPAKARCSFTLPIRIPQSGAGVKVWDIWHGVLSFEDACARAQEEAPELHRYALGELFVHSGDQLHQIAADALPVDGEVRLTFQGHGRKTDEGWEIYW